MADKSNILIFGATGSIGAYITQALLDDRAHFGRFAVFTSPHSLQTKGEMLDKLRRQGVDILVGDIGNQDDVRKAYADFDTVVSALGRTAIAAQIPLIELAAATPSVRRFLPSEYGTDIEYGPASKHEKPHQAKLKVRAALASVRDRLEYAYIVTGPYADYPFYLAQGPPGAPEAGSWDVKKQRAVIVGDERGRVSLSACVDVGRFVSHALTHWEQARYRALKLNSFTTTPHEILQEFESQTGQKWHVESVSLEELRRREAEAWEQGAPHATTFTLRRIWAEGGTLYERRDNEDIGVVATQSLRALVRESIQRQLE
ncbi:isoflavone reductase family protein [Aspergillus saccharolyticus JOP 1030-1]|uniref:Isoflavone reductase family protein n=1 Tax=Aspergillus saccharolyticus JOP 1030-1 TaxID=1450539 RepID=A0A318ZQL9_9EURO|nr:isoflavone reductase family protein [Aspergillus saccharolyticus JOP 1030-1]PYH46250.1 isoflavone reductase family protein [Aspergillus saccharolyticus JOP 1030-1]